MNQILLNILAAVVTAIVLPLISFDKDAQLIALNKAKSIVLAELKEDTRSFIEKNYGDLTSWITNQIEASINILKNA